MIHGVLNIKLELFLEWPLGVVLLSLKITEPILWFEEI